LNPLRGSSLDGLFSSGLHRRLFIFKSFRLVDS